MGDFAGARITIKIDAEGNEFDILRGAQATLRRTPRPNWLVEISFSENFGVAVNPHFEDIFQIFWSNGYRAKSVDTEATVDSADVQRWLARGERDFGFVNFAFQCAA